MNRRRLMLTAFLANIVGLAIFMQWLSETDPIYRHYEGPPALFYGSLGFLGLGFVAGVGWFGSGLFSAAERSEHSRRSISGIVGGVLLFLLMIPSALCLLYGSVGILEDLGFFKPTPVKIKSPDEIQALAKNSVTDLENGDVKARSEAALQLGSFGPAVPWAVPNIRAALQDPDIYVRVCAAQAMWQVTGQPDEALPVLIEALEQESATPHATPNGNLGPAGGAIITLADMGSRAAVAIPVLERLIQNSRVDKGVRNDAERVLAYIRNTLPDEQPSSVNSP